MTDLPDRPNVIIPIEKMAKEAVITATASDLALMAFDFQVGADTQELFDSRSRRAAIAILARFDGILPDQRRKRFLEAFYADPKL